MSIHDKNIVKSINLNIIGTSNKPKKSKSEFSRNRFIFLITKLLLISHKPSKRNELEIVDLLNKYERNKLTAEFLGRGGAWLDTGSMMIFIILLILFRLWKIDKV